MHAKFAQWYDIHYRSIKNYEVEVERIAYILEKLGTQPRALLDIACGTGEHARILRESYGYDVDGIDLQPNFIEIAQGKNPDGDFTVADMRDFHLPRKYDAITCLFSSLAYAETLDGLDATIQSIARHLRPGGWLLIEPWLEPSEWKDGLIDATESHDEASQVRILQTRQGSSDGKVSVLKIDYQIDTPDETFEFSETHRLGLFTREEIESALADKHFESRYLPKGVLSSPLHLACYTP